MVASRHALERALLLIFAGLLLAFLTLPILALLLSSGGAELAAGLGHPLVWPALRLSLMTTTASSTVVVVLGTPLAWLLARAQGRWVRFVEAAVQVPIVVPPAVAGIALLAAFGRRGLLAGWLYPVGWSASFTTTAVVLAEVFVSAPFFAQAATSAFRRVDGQLLIVARSFGASPLRLFFKISLPMAAPGLVAGAAMSWSRALGEFGATLMFAGNLEGKTQTLPLAIYTALESDARAARALSILLVGVAVALLGLVRSLLRHATEAPP
jgi:molybdate transport system permease protein